MYWLWIKLDRFFGKLYDLAFESSRHYKKELGRFRVAIVLLALYRLSQLWFDRAWLYYDSAWKVDKIAGVSDLIGYSLLVNGNEYLVPYFFSACFIILLALLHPKSPSILFWVVWVFYFSLNQAAHLTISAGTQLTLFCFLILGFQQKENGRNSNLLNRLVWLSLRLHVCYLYLVAGVSKLFGVLWPSGKSFEIVLGIDAFSLPLPYYLPEGALIYTLITLAILMYQLVFPFAVWVYKIKYPLAVVGILFHVGVFFINGIVEFSAVMFSAYLLFVPINKQLFILAFKHTLGAKKRPYRS